jgi:hypothetical protein
MKSLLAAVLALGFATTSAHAACSYPKAPEKIPDGRSATLEEMRAAQLAVKDYDKEITAYTDCLNLEYDAELSKGGTNLSDKQKKELEKRRAQKQNAAVDEDQQVASRLNEQIRIYKAKQAAAKG